LVYLKAFESLFGGAKNCGRLKLRKKQDFLCGMYYKIRFQLGITSRRETLLALVVAPFSNPKEKIFYTSF